MPRRYGKLRAALLAGATSMLLALTGCQPAQTPAPAPATGAPQSQSAPAPANTAAPAPATTSAPGATPTQPPTKPDGIYTPVSYREIYQKISSDYQEIATLTNQVLEGKPMPTADILRIYEEAKVARIGEQARPLRAFARDPARAKDFPDAAEFYKSPTFLDDPVIEAITGTGSAASLTPAQRRQAIQKGIQRIMYHWSRHYIQRASGDLRPGLVDEGWAIYMGLDVDGKYPNSLSALALSREGNFNRSGALDTPLRQALSRAQQAAAKQDKTAYDAAANDVYSRFHAIFYLATARYMNESVKSATAKNLDSAGVQQVEGLSFYQSIQPAVAKADAAADKTVVAFFTADPASLTAQMRDDALAALNKGFDALMLKPDDRVTPASFN